MSGIIPDSILSVDIEGADQYGSDQYYCLVSFPQKVIVTGVKFTVNEEMRGGGEDSINWGRQWTLNAVKGRKSVGAGAEPYYEDIVPFFGDNAKPTVNCGVGDWTSNTVAPADTYQWYSYEPYDGNVAQMDPDEYLMLYVSSDSGDYEFYDPANAKVTITLSYTGSSPNI